MLDVTKDIIKTYHETSILKVHLDNNVLESNNYYIVKFYVKGNDRYYKSYYKDRTHRFYFGLPPNPG